MRVAVEIAVVGARARVCISRVNSVHVYTLARLDQSTARYTFEHVRVSNSDVSKKKKSRLPGVQTDDDSISNQLEQRFKEHNYALSVKPKKIEGTDFKNSNR